MSNFVSITYLHLLASLAIVTLSTLNPLLHTPVQYLIGFLVTLVLLFIVLFLAPGPVKYLVFGAYLLILGQVLAPAVDELRKRGVLEEVIASVAGIFLAMTAVGVYAKGRFLGFGPYLFAGLIGLLLARLGLVAAGWMGIEGGGTQTVSKALSWVGTILFAVYVAYDTQVLHRRALLRGKPDYVGSSLGLFLDIVNLFVNIGDIFE